MTSCSQRARSQRALTISRHSGAKRLVGVALAATIFCSCQGPAPYQSLPGIISEADIAKARLVPERATDVRLSNRATMPERAIPQIALAAYQTDGQATVPHGSPLAGTATPSNMAPNPANCGPMVFAQPPPCPCHGDPHDVATGCRPWTPPGIASPWPEDEYLCDGGDQTPAVKVRSNWSIIGLNLEDTIVHYDTLDGQTRVEPSNRVCVYAPRFAAVRRVHGIQQSEIHERVAGLEQPIPIEGLGDVQIATTAVQPVQPNLHRGTVTASGFLERTPPVGLENRQGITGMHGAILPYEAPLFVGLAQLDNSEKARLAQSVQAAAVWSADQAVQVLIDNIATHEAAGISAAAVVHTYELRGKPRLRVCKAAPQKDARPGETIDFTIRFDNVGDQKIGNVTVIDNLTTRLEYVEGSQTCSLKASFSSADNQGDSLVLRWEVEDPLKINDGGIIRFKCRVR